MVAKFYGLIVSYALIASFSWAILTNGRFAVGVNGFTPTTCPLVILKVGLNYEFTYNEHITLAAALVSRH